jgi:hypothetical protein
LTVDVPSIMHLTCGWHGGTLALQRETYSRAEAPNTI